MSRKIIIEELKNLYFIDAENNSKQIENKIFKFIKENYKNIDEDYGNIAYEIIGELKEMKSLEEMHTFLDKKITNIYNYPSYKALNNKRDIDIDRIVNPPNVQEGVYECSKCKSKKTYLFQLQTRSGDEGFTTYVTCVNCGNKWKFN